MHSLARILLAALVAFGSAVPVASGEPSGSYPSRPIRMIVPFAPGGASDFIARIVSSKCQETIGHQCVVDNRAGAAGNIGLEAAAKAAPDGYTLFLGNVGTIAINPSLYPTLTVKPTRDLIPITRLASIPGILVAHPSFSPGTVGELIEHARRAPGKLNYGSPGAGSGHRILMELLKKEARVDIVEVPYKGGAGQAVAGVVAGETQISFATIASVTGFLKAGKLKALATMTEQRVAAFPDVPTMVEAGFPRIVDSQWQGIFAPKGTPGDIVEKLNAGLLRTMQQSDITDRLNVASAQTYTTPTPREFAAFVDSESGHWAAIIKEVGASID